MEPELSGRIAELETKVDAMYASVEKLRKYFLWTGIITVVLFVVPLIGLIFVIPSFINSYAQIGNFDSSGSSNAAPGEINSLNSLLQ